MSSDVALYTTVAAVTAAAAGVGGYFAFRGSGEDPGTGVDCEYDPSTEKAVCDTTSNTLSYVRAGKSTNDASCAAESITSSTVPCDDPASPLDCVTTPWSDWSACDCLLKQSSRTRTITRQASVGGAACGPLVEVQDCSDSCGVPLPPDAPDCGDRDHHHDRWIVLLFMSCWLLRHQLGWQASVHQQRCDPVEFASLQCTVWTRIRVVDAGLFATRWCR